MTTEEAREKKAKKDREWQKKVREARTMKIIQETENIKKLNRMILKRTDKIQQMNLMGESLRSELLEHKFENEAIVKLMKEKVKAECIMKQKYKLVFKHHSLFKEK